MRAMDNMPQAIESCLRRWKNNRESNMQTRATYSIDSSYLFQQHVIQQHVREQHRSSFIWLSMASDRYRKMSPRQGPESSLVLTTNHTMRILKKIACHQRTDERVQVESKWKRQF